MLHIRAFPDGCRLLPASLHIASLPDISVFPVRAFPGIISGLLHLFPGSLHIPPFPDVCNFMFGHFGICPSSSRCGFPVFFLIRFLFHHFRMFPSFIFENFGCSCLLHDSLLVPSFPDVSIFLTFSDFPVLFSIRFLFHHFRMFRLSCSNFPGVVRFASHSIMSGFFRLLRSGRPQGVLIQGPFL